MANTPNQLANALSPVSNASYLAQGEKALAEELFRTQAQPLQKVFQEQAAINENILGTRGVEFGGLGAESRRRLAETQSNILGQVASNIATTLGQTALERAFSANEAAKAF